jgi:hypothetical protein
LEDFLPHRPGENSRDSGQRLIGGTRYIVQPPHHCLDISARNGVGQKLAPMRQHVTTDRRVALLPGFIPLLGVLFEIPLCQFSKGASTAFGTFVGGRVFALLRATSARLPVCAHLQVRQHRQRRL